MRKYTGLRRLVAGAGVVALAAGGVLVASSAAVAAVDDAPGQPGAPSVGSLTINKYKGSPVEEGQAPDPANLLNGVEFIVTPIGRLNAGVCVPIDLTVAAQWVGIETLYPATPGAPVATPEAPFCLGTPIQVGGANPRTVNGQISLPNLALGLYYVQEGVDHGNNDIVSKVPNFVVSVPTSLGAAAGWEYDVVVYPKNAVLNEPSKTIAATPSAMTVGSNVTWTVTVPIPQLNNNETFNSAIITDDFDDRLSYVSSTATINGAATTDFTYDTTAGTWTFGSTARGLMNAAMGSSLVIEVVTRVDSVGNGTIPNDTYSSAFNDTTIPGVIVPYTYWGQLHIQKNDDSTPVRGLAGAEFKVFDVANASGACPAFADLGAAAAVATGTSDANGVVQWAGVTPTDPLGLWITNSNTATASPQKVYCVYETVVPAGHSAVTFDAAVTITPGVPTTGESSIVVVNSKKAGPDLPLTGAAGTALLSAGGLLLVASGIMALVFLRRRRAGTAA